MSIKFFATMLDVELDYVEGPSPRLLASLMLHAELNEALPCRTLVKDV
jgi:hypothetical protein